VIVHPAEEKQTDDGGGSGDYAIEILSHHVWVKQKGQENRVKVMFHPSWNVYTLKREIVKQLLDPILSSRESTRTTETDEEKKN